MTRVHLRVIISRYIVVTAAALVSCSGETVNGKPTEANSESAGQSGGSFDPSSNAPGPCGELVPAPGLQFYASDVHSELLAACGSCHDGSSQDGCAAPMFMASDAKASYEAMTAYGGLVVHLDDSNLVLHGEHGGPALTSAQQQLVQAWLDIERPTPPPGKTQRVALAELGGCMSYDTFESSGLAGLAYQSTASGDTCGSCHEAGVGGTWISSNAREMFAQTTQLPWIKRLVDAVFDCEGHFEDFAPSNRLIDKAELATSCGYFHPAADIVIANEVAVAMFTDESLTAWRSGSCP